MRKLILTLLLLFTLTTVSAQSEFRRNYTKILVTTNNKKGDWEFASNNFVFNYKGEPTFKMIMNDGSIRFFDQVTDLENVQTEGGLKYESAAFKEQGKPLIIYLQLFDDAEWGIRVIFENGDMIQFAN
jgi:hypothetical protein